MAETTDNRLRLLAERIEKLKAEKKAINDDINEVYAEAKAVGYDTKILRQAISLREMQADARQEQDAILDIYRSALGIA